MASLGFYSWMQRGLAAHLLDGDDGGEHTEGHGAHVRVRVELRQLPPPPSPATGIEKPIVDLELVGPGHVVGIEPGMVIRVWPKPGTTDAETDYFPLIEFAESDFPWRYSPQKGVALPDGSSRRRPWLALVVLREDEVQYAPAGPNQRLSSISVQRASGQPLPLPPIDEIHLWAHAQVTGGPLSDAQLAATLRENPERSISRVLCPRVLEAKQSYRAFLVPTYGAGREAGLGLPVTSVLDQAWTDTASSVRLPVYYEWSFLAGAVGSFYDLARRLVPRVLTGPGTRTMDVSKPGHTKLDDLATRVEVGGALRPVQPPGTPEFEWPVGERDAWRDKLAEIVNEAEALLTRNPDEAPPKPELAPPLYGRWYGTHGTIDDAPGLTDRSWFQDLNESPHHRVPAALGTNAVQNDQQALMASAWQQVDGLLEINQHIRQAQLAREASLQSWRRHVHSIRLDRPGKVLQIASAIFGRVRSTGGKTVLDAIRKSPIPDGFFDPVWRRITRPLGPLGRRQGRPGLDPPPPGHDTVDQVNDGSLTPTPQLPEMPSGGIGPGAGGPGECPHCISPQVADAIANLTPAAAYRLGEKLFLEGWHYAGYGALWRVAVMRLGLLVVEAAATPDGLNAFKRRVRRHCTGALTPEDIEEAPPVGGGWTPSEPVPDPAGPLPPPAPEGEPPGPAEQDFRDAAEVLLEVVNASPSTGPVLTKANIPELVQDIVKVLDPRQGVARGVKRRLTAAGWAPLDPLEPLLVVPTFPQPMYEALRDLSTEWIMPGIGDIPANTLGLVTTNQAFVEAYMVGLNHEMGRELLWHEYPNDLRGTYFRQFWDVRGRFPVLTDPEPAFDIEPIHTWDESALGTNTSRVPANPLVVFVRGDLLHRYPNVITYLAVADAQPDGTPPGKPGSMEEHSLFRGKLGSDAGVYGFDVTADQARGGPGGAAGWYVVLQEPPAEPRFGIARVPGQPAPTPGQHVHASDLSSALAAQRLFRAPVRVAFHARMMLPPETP